jgi:16S rRNA (guanine966-N2)-methyltransferase
MKLKICGGEFRGRFILTPKGDTTRPTSERLRQTVFNILGPRVQDAVVLDPYAGSGAIGIEALSRGASFAYLIEMNKSACDAIKKNLEELGLTSKTEVIYTDCHKAVHVLPKGKINFVYLDPPYAKTMGDLASLERFLENLDKEGILENNALIFLEMSFKYSQINLEKMPYYHLKKSRKIGDSCLHEISYQSLLP